MDENQTNDIKPTEHATALRLGGDGILIFGRSGAGKSSLALSLLDTAWTAGGSAYLVADDRVFLTAEDGALIATCPEAIAGLIEVRGIGILAVDAIQATDIRLAVTLLPEDQVPRMPDYNDLEIAGIRVPHITIVEKSAWAAASVRTVLRTLPSPAPGVVC